MYGKHFQSMYTGSLVGKGSVSFAVWGYVIAHACKGYVELNPAVIAFLIGDDEQRVIEAIETFCSPDPKSRTKEHEGRRLFREGEYLYRVVNHEKYRDTRDEEHRREYMRGYMQDYRKQPVNSGKPELAKSEPEAKTKTKTKTNTQYKKEKPSSVEIENYCTSIGLPAADGAAMFLHWEEKGWGKVKNWKLTIQKWRAFGYLPSQKQSGKSKLPDPNKAKRDEEYERFRREREQRKAQTV